MTLEKAGENLRKVRQHKIAPLISLEEIEKNDRNIKYLVIHCAATKPSMDVPIERIRKWHLDRGFNDVGYHFYIRRDGSLHKGRDIDTTGAHVKGYNSVSIGICYEGGIDESGEPEDNRTPYQMRALIRILCELVTVYPDANIRGHRDFEGVNKACPSFDVISWCKDVELKHN